MSEASKGFDIMQLWQRLNYLFTAAVFMSDAGGWSPKNMKSYVNKGRVETSLIPREWAGIHDHKQSGIPKERLEIHVHLIISNIVNSVS